MILMPMLRLKFQRVNIPGQDFLLYLVYPTSDQRYTKGRSGLMPLRLYRNRERFLDCYLEEVDGDYPETYDNSDKAEFALLGCDLRHQFVHLLLSGGVLDEGLDDIDSH